MATPSTRLIFLQPDIARNPSPFVKSADGKDPLQDLRVRKAMNMAIDRKAIVQRIMDGMATPASDTCPTACLVDGQGPEIKYDPEGAKEAAGPARLPQWV